LDGKMRLLFAGGNTAQGFYSFYQYIPPPHARRVYILKGGPGVGKSTLLSYLGEKIRQRGYLVEMFQCSSDNSSYDGLAVPALKVAILDGTAPHVVDPQYPGARDEIVNLGEYWCGEALRSEREEIVALTEQVASCFEQAYAYLKAAAGVHQAMKQLRARYLDRKGLAQTLRELEECCFGHALPRDRTIPPVRRLFASALTPEGAVHFLDQLFSDVSKRVIVRGSPGSGRAWLLEHLLRAGEQRGYRAEAFHCGFHPQTVEHLYWPEIDTACISSWEPHVVHQLRTDDVLVDLEERSSPATDDDTEHLHRSQQMFRWCLKEATDWLQRAKQVHDHLERHYIANMDHAAINRLAERLLGEILP